MGKFLDLPPVLKPYASMPIWVLWKREFQSARNKWTKVPYCAFNPSRKAKCNDPSTWVTFDEALAALRAGHGDGIGLNVLNTDLGPLDLDHCRDPQTGELEPAARNLVDQANSYTEVTPSDTGLRIITRASGPKVHRRQPVPNANGMVIETYRRAERYITITGNVLAGAPDQLADGDTLLDQTVAWLDAAKQSKRKGKGGKRKQPLDLDDIIKNGEGGHFDGDRSDAVWFVVHELLRRGVADDDILNILLDRANKISDHVYDQSDPRTYAQRQIVKARNNAGLGWGVGGASAAGIAPTPGMRRIVKLIEGERHRIVDEAEDALIAAGGFDIYQRDAVMMRPVRHPLPAATRHGLKRATVVWRLMPVKPLYLIEMLGRCARFQSYDRRRKAWIDKDCPSVIGETLLAREGVWRVPVLIGSVHTPQLRADGSLLTTPGYDPQTQLLYQPDGEHFPTVADQPSKEDAQRALEVIKQAITTFPFNTEADRSVALSLLLTGVCRRTLDHAPLHAFTAPAPGTGKSLLVDLGSILLSGQPAPVLSAEIDAVEFEKRLGASLMSGDAVISFDNCTRPLDQALLCQALSQARLNLRVLGYSQNRDVTMSALFTATGNNLVLQGDLPRRSLRCEMDAKVERPELRVFPGAHIQTEFRRQRGELVAALLTILRAYQVSGVISSRPPLGGFEMWSHWVRDALVWLDCTDPCDTIEAIRAGNPERERHEAVVLAWNDHFGLGAVVTMRGLIEATAPGQFVLQQSSSAQRLYDALRAVAEDRRHRGAISNERLGRWLNRVNGKFEKGLRIIRAGSRHGYPLWQLSS